MATGGAELRVWEPGTRVLDVVHIGVLSAACSSERNGSVAGIAQAAVSAGPTHLASRHLGWVNFLRCDNVWLVTWTCQRQSWVTSGSLPPPSDLSLPLLPSSLLLPGSGLL